MYCTSYVFAPDIIDAMFGFCGGLDAKCEQHDAPLVARCISLSIRKPPQSSAYVENLYTPVKNRCTNTPPLEGPTGDP